MLGAALSLASSAFAAPSAPKPILDKDAELARFSWRDNLDNDWFKARIPFFESPDRNVDATYYYRWELVTKHMNYGSPETGYTFTEFINRPGWSGAYGAISCPLGLQMNELRWLKDRRLTDDFARYWFSTPGAQPRSYSNWYGDALWNSYLVNGDKSLLVSLLPSMKSQYQGWMKEHWRPDHQMFAWSGMHDGMEFTIGSRQTKDPFAGGESYRPTLNSYIYGDLMALAKTCDLADQKTEAATYRAKAEALKARLQTELWDARRGFFLSQFADDEESDGFKIAKNTRMYDDGKYKGSPYGRELSGFVPWQFHLPDAGKGYENAWKTITDSETFFGPHGLYFAERHDPLFTIAPRSCVWSGNNWPYANSQILVAMANVINDYPQDVLSKSDYWKVFDSYTLQQRQAGQPYIAETSDPDTGRWTQDTPNMSEHYFHSSYCDLLISGLVGLRPREDDTIEVNPLAPDSWDYFALDGVNYHGHNLSIVWDKDGERYHRGAGLTIWADGEKLASSPNLEKLTAPLPDTPLAQAPEDGPHNFAVNNNGAYFPRLRASYSAQGSSTGNLNDGVFYYHSYRPLNRWTTQGSPNDKDTLELDFGVERPLENLKLYFLDDGLGGNVRVPQSYTLDFWDGTRWQPIPRQTHVPTQPEGHKPNIVSFPLLSASKVRATFTPQDGWSVGMTEFEAWGHAPLPLAPASLPASPATEATASASYTSRFDKAEEINDGKVEMNGGRNRWTAFESPNATDWLQLDWKEPQTIARVELFFWSDANVHLPKKYTLQFWDGTTWQNVEETNRTPETPTANASNEVTFRPVQTAKLRLLLDHDTPAKSGLTEWMVWPE